MEHTPAGRFACWLPSQGRSVPGWLWTTSGRVLSNTINTLMPPVSSEVMTSVRRSLQEEDQRDHLPLSTRRPSSASLRAMNAALKSVELQASHLTEFKVVN